MNLFARWPRVTLALVYAALPTIFSLVGGVESLVNGSVPGWGEALRREGLYWAACVVLFVPTFRLCRWLHEGPPRWPRYAAGLGLGAVFAVAVFPLIFQALRFGLWLVAPRYFADGAPTGFATAYRGLFPHLITASVVMYACAVVAWQAVTHYREARERRLEAAELGALLQQAQLQALRSQLNPHFLFNTLHSIAELIHENPRLAEQMLLQLGELLRKSLKTQSLEVPLGEEIDFIRSYLAIEQMRLGPRLELVWSVDPAVLAARVPSLILQPLVENAVRHGTAATAGPSRLAISAARADGELRLEVRDNGPGLDADAGNNGAGIGLANTRARLERLYGDRASFRLTNDDGLVVSMSLPWLA
ncbi:MAG TPA: sensor histidine kinase [Lacunisphaera sp.]|nr:sensor histidine kinase [Lacunisphaera sp.]